MYYWQDESFYDEEEDYSEGFSHVEYMEWLYDNNSSSDKKPDSEQDLNKKEKRIRVSYTTEYFRTINNNALIGVKLCTIIEKYKDKDNTSYILDHYCERHRDGKLSTRLNDFRMKGDYDFLFHRVYDESLYESIEECISNNKHYYYYDKNHDYPISDYCFYCAFRERWYLEKAEGDILFLTFNFRFRSIETYGLFKPIILKKCSEEDFMQLIAIKG